MYTTAELFIMAFSPPYGDGTAADVHQTRSNLFSPPYGDGTYAEPYEEVRTRFRPLTGMVRKIQTKHRA